MNGLWIFSIVLLIMWALGLVSSYTMGGFIHILLVLAIIIVMIGITQRRQIGVQGPRMDAP